MRLFLLLIFSCLSSIAHAGLPGLDVNDVTILFPLDSAKKPFPEVRLQAAISAQQFADLTSYVYQNVHPGSEEITSPGSPRAMDSWRIVALRVDPCFPESPMTCVPQVRLVAQAVDDGYGLKEQAIHLLYQLTSQELGQVIAQLQTLKQQSLQLGVQTSGQSLRPYPGLVAELSTAAPRADLTPRIRNLIARFCTPSRLRHATMTGSDDRRFGFWIFSGGDIVGLRWVPQAIPNVDLQHFEIAKGTKFDFADMRTGLIQASDGVGAFPLPNETSSNEHNSMRTFLRPDSASSIPQGDVVSLFEVMNPKLANPRNTDCASCHLNNELLKQQSDLHLLNPFRDVYKNPFGVTGFAQAQYSHALGADSAEIRVLGYDQDQIIITPLVATSSAEVASSLNALLHLPPPTSRDCSDFKVFECFNKIGSYAADPKAGVDNYCLRLCK